MLGWLKANTSRQTPRSEHASRRTQATQSPARAALAGRVLPAPCRHCSWTGRAAIRHFSSALLYLPRHLRAAMRLRQRSPATCWFLSGFGMLFQRRKRFFFEKKNQKTFANLYAPWGRGRYQNNQKFFASFFQKRSASLPSASRVRPTAIIYRLGHNSLDVVCFNSFDQAISVVAGKST